VTVQERADLAGNRYCRRPARQNAASVMHDSRVQNLFRGLPEGDWFAAAGYTGEDELEGILPPGEGGCRVLGRTAGLWR
jgi:hypothetical protein